MVKQKTTVLFVKDGVEYKPTKKAGQFMSANKESGVVSGHAFNGGGGNYRLADGRSFDLTLEDMRSMPMPRWDFEANGN